MFFFLFSFSFHHQSDCYSYIWFQLWNGWMNEAVHWILHFKTNNKTFYVSFYTIKNFVGEKKWNRNEESGTKKWKESWRKEKIDNKFYFIFIFFIVSVVQTSLSLSSSSFSPFSLKIKSMNLIWLFWNDHQPSTKQLRSHWKITRQILNKQGNQRGKVKVNRCNFKLF